MTRLNIKIKKIIKKFIPWLDICDKIHRTYLKSNWFSNKNIDFIAYKFFHKNFKKYNCYISPKAKIKGEINFPHPMGIVIGAECIIGENVTIYQNVTLGRKHSNIIGCPKIGNNVIIYCNTTIIGNVTIGDNAVIGCNSVVMRDVKSNETVSGIVK